MSGAVMFFASVARFSTKKPFMHYKTISGMVLVLGDDAFSTCHVRPCLCGCWGSALRILREMQFASFAFHFVILNSVPQNAAEN